MPSSTCGLIFGPTSGTPPPETASADHREARCEEPGLMKLAMDNCAKFCGYCCKTPEYNCLNKPVAQTGLDCSTMASKCTDAQWKPLLAENCPATCGLCLTGGCVDKASDCASQQSLCLNVNTQDWAKENCARTCNKCAPTAGAATTAAPSGSNPPAAVTTTKAPSVNCVNLDTNCINWARNGKFCDNVWYQNEWYKCRKSCGKC